MLLKVEVGGEGLGPNEVFLEVETLSGFEEVLVDVYLVKNGEIDVGYPILQEGAATLVELPRETTSGKWRVWVNSRNLRWQDEV